MTNKAGATLLVAEELSHQLETSKLTNIALTLAPLGQGNSSWSPCRLHCSVYGAVSISLVHLNNGWRYWVRWRDLNGASPVGESDHSGEDGALAAAVNMVMDNPSLAAEIVEHWRDFDLHQGGWRAEHLFQGGV